MARPVAFALFARIQGTSALGALFVIWTSVELGARLATLGLDRGLRRWSGDDRAAATAGALVVSAIAGLVVAIAVIALLPFLVPLEADAVWPARLVIAVTVPLFAAGSVALRAARGETQIAMFVLARSVVEPSLLLVAGLAASGFVRGTNALLLGFLISIAGATAIAAWTAVRALGLAALVRALVQPRRWPLRELVPLSVPLGVADVLQSAQGKLDLVAVALVTYSGTAIAGYAIATTLVSGFTQVRQGYEQVIAPIAAELRGRRGDLTALLTDGMRWNALIALPMSLALLVFPAPFLNLLGGSSAAIPVLVALVIGRAVETVLGPATSILTVVSHPRLALWAAAAGIAISLAGDLVLSSLGAAGIAAASSLGAIAAAGLAAYWLARREQISPRWSALVALRRGRPAALVVESVAAVPIIAPVAVPMMASAPVRAAIAAPVAAASFGPMAGRAGAPRAAHDLRGTPAAALIGPRGWRPSHSRVRKWTRPSLVRRLPRPLFSAGYETATAIAAAGEGARDPRRSPVRLRASRRMRRATAP